MQTANEKHSLPLRHAEKFAGKGGPILESTDDEEEEQQEEQQEEEEHHEDGGSTDDEPAAKRQCSDNSETSTAAWMEVETDITDMGDIEDLLED